MQHTIEDLIRRINAMHTKALELHRTRNQYSELSGKKYDKATCEELVCDIQALARGIAHDTEGDEILTEMEYKKNG